MTMQNVQLDPKKGTILIVSDSAAIHTGLAKVVREVFKPLYALDKWNIAQLGWFNTHTGEEIPWPIISTKLDQNGKPMKGDELGQKTFEETIQKLKPDIVWTIADPWTWKFMGESPQRSKYELIAYTCVDSEPISRRYQNIFRTASTVVTFGKWPHDVLMDSMGMDSEVIPHGVNLDTYHQDPEARSTVRARMVGPADDKIVIGTVARNQPRKNLGAMFELVHRLYYGRYSTCGGCGKITLHDFNPATRQLRSKPNTCRWCGSRDLLHAQKDDRWIWYYHGAARDLGYDIDELKNWFALDNIMFLNAHIRQGVGVSEKDLNGVYNAIDIFTLPTTCEGFGLPILESMAAGTPVVVPNYSAYTDWAPTGGEMIDIGARFIDHQVGSVRVMPQMEHWIEIMLKLADPVYRTELGQKAVEKAKEYDWRSITPMWEKLFDSILEGPTASSDWKRSVSV